MICQIVPKECMGYGIKCLEDVMTLFNANAVKEEVTKNAKYLIGGNIYRISQKIYIILKAMMSGKTKLVIALTKI